jgi:hypothetical protein
MLRRSHVGQELIDLTTHGGGLARQVYRCVQYLVGSRFRFEGRMGDILDVGGNFAPAVCDGRVNGVRAAYAAGAMVIMVPDVAAPAPEIEALCTLVASDLRQVGEIIRRDAQAHYFSAG